HQQQPPSQQQQQQQPSPVPAPAMPGHSENIKGADPHNHNLSDDRALAKTFGVSPQIMQDLKLQPHASDREDIAIGSGGLISGRDRDVVEGAAPREPDKWVHVRSSAGAALWLPKDRAMADRIVGVYFERLNYHRPVFLKHEFGLALDSLYRGDAAQSDPGFVCSAYLVLALGTLSELSHRACGLDRQAREKQEPSPAAMNAVRKLMPPDWPEHEEFFHRALAVKPELRVTVSSLQALILLHWYLYTERQGRTLWRLVGSLVRLGIELGLNHDPTTQQIFSEHECRLRIRLWGIVLMHDRGTSIQLGRPLAIAPNDSSTPQPAPLKTSASDVSEHFLYSAPIAEIQADIIQSLYSPQALTADQIQRHATRILKSMVEFRNRMPDRYKWYFSGTEDWPIERKYRLVQEISEDEGLTLLKIGITRILLLRALFSSKDLHYPQRRRALIDAIIISHNIIVVHHQLIRFPDIAFFVSPIPLHIAAMVILYGHMSRCEALSKQVALEDVWMALDMLPSFRWRWERKDNNGGHPLIARLAEKVLEVNLRQAGPTAQPVLIPEINWDIE
ncbi:fungal-specific transcription factor domain-containing protein, partial [Vararia minispora EC-137]